VRGDETQSVRYVLPGRPKTWQRAYDVGRQKRTARAAEVNAAKRMHQGYALQALGPGGRFKWSLEGAFRVEVIGYYPDAVVGDSDRLPGCAMDALQGLLYKSDRQVRSQAADIICDGSPARTQVTVTRLAVDPVQDAATRAKGKK
jgi:hypothetical protein